MLAGGKAEPSLTGYYYINLALRDIGWVVTILILFQLSANPVSVDDRRAL